MPHNDIVAKQKIAKIAVPAPIYQTYDYLIPDGQPNQFVPGTRVKVQLGHRHCIGVLIEVTENQITGSETNSPQSLKPVLEFGSEQNNLPANIYELISWSADYYCHPIGECLHAALPKLLRSKIRPGNFETRLWKRTDLAFDGPSSAKKQKQILEAFENQANGLQEEQLKALGFTLQQLKTLEEKAYLTSLTVEHLPAPQKSANTLASTQLNTEQLKTVSELQRYEQDSGFNVSLLEGITGSGKTEVYIRRAQQVLASGGQVLILIPEINLSPQTFARFQKHLDVPIALLHSGLSNKSKYLNWKQSKEGQVRVVIGTRSAIFAPLQELKLIIVDEEHDSSFKQSEGFKYSGRDLAIKRGQLEKCQVLLGSATPSLESLHKAQHGHYNWLKLTKRATNSTLPELSLIDVKSRDLEHGCSRPLLQAIKKELDEGNQIILFQNKRGFAPTLMCQSCGTLIECKNCDSRMTVHSASASLHCHHCERQEAIPRHCPSCHAETLVPIGFGTERIEHALNQHFPNTEIIRIDRDSTRNTKTMEQHIQFVRSGKPAILIGTQMLAKGHDFPNVTLVAVIDADGLFFSSDFRAIERGAQLLTQVSGRAGRGEKAGRVLVQTRLAEHPLFVHLAKHDYLSVALEELEERELCHLPPQAKMISIRAESKQQETSITALQNLRTGIQKSADSFLKTNIRTEENNENPLQLVGPFEAAISRKRGSYRAYLSIFCNDASLRAHLQINLPHLLTHYKQRACRLYIDVDPIEYQ